MHVVKDFTRQGLNPPRIQAFAVDPRASDDRAPRPSCDGRHRRSRAESLPGNRDEARVRNDHHEIESRRDG